MKPYSYQSCHALHDLKTTTMNISRCTSRMVRTTRDVHNITPSIPIRQRNTSRVRPFSTTRHLRDQHHKQSFNHRLRSAWNGTKIQWKPIPVGLGIAFLGGLQFYRVQAREQERLEQEDKQLDQEGRPKKRERIRPSGPWYEDQTCVINVCC